MHQDLRVRVIRLEHVRFGLKLLPQLAVVVDAPIECDSDQRLLGLDLVREDGRLPRLVGQVGAETLTIVDHGLAPARVVDDAQASVDEGDVDDDAVVVEGAVAESGGAVGASVLDRFIERVEPGFGDGFKGRRWRTVSEVVKPDDARDAAHGRGG
jgi:hypothetical protein